MGTHESEAPAKIAVVGGGRLGEAVALSLQSGGAYRVVVFESDEERQGHLAAQGLECRDLGPSLRGALERNLDGVSAVVSVASASVAPEVARLARDAGCHYVDANEDIAARSAVMDVARASDTGFAIGCGLAPGLVSVLLEDMIARSGESAEVTAFVGVLPEQATNKLGYANMWGLDGLMSEYFGPCKALAGNGVTELPALSRLEDVTVLGQRFEAFTTAGSIDEIVERHQGRLRSLVFKTLRHPGHLEMIRFLLEDLRLSERRYMFRNLLMNGLPQVSEDMVVISFRARIVSGSDAGTTEERAWSLRFLPGDRRLGGARSCSNALAAAHVSAVTDILVRGIVAGRGLFHAADFKPALLRQSPFMSGILPEEEF
jgi:saccharopine dehydrogenase-like NADP-dependent oxidoreductase